MAGLRVFPRRASLLLRASAMLVRRHYFSMLTAAIMVGALFVALTSSSFDGPAKSKSPSRVAQVARAAAAVPTPGPSRIVVYYIISNDSQRLQIMSAMNSDDLNLARQQPHRAPEVGVYFLLADTPSEESYAARLITQLAESATSQGYILKVLDLRE